MEKFLSAIFMILVAPYMGIAIILNSEFHFAKIFVAINLLLIFILYFVSKKKKFPLWPYINVIIVANILLWTSLFLSQHSIPDANPVDTARCSIAGFPWKVFTLPCAAGGGNYVPLGMYVPFYLNYLLWIGIASFTLFPNIKKRLDKYKTLLSIIGIWIILSGLGIFVLAFD